MSTIEKITKKDPSLGEVLRSPEEHVGRLEAEDVRLVDDRPLYYALLPNPSPESGVLDRIEVQAARSRLATIIAIDKNSVLALHGKSIEEARASLEKIEKEGERSMAAGE
ncbi:MAG TPA: hypothetical protein VJH71_01400 [Candidatus Paceibacterota bacterium]